MIFTLKIFLCSGALDCYLSNCFVLGFLKCHPLFEFRSIPIVGSHMEGEIRRIQSTLFLEVLR